MNNSKNLVAAQSETVQAFVRTMSIKILYENRFHPYLTHILCYALMTERGGRERHIPDSLLTLILHKYIIYRD